MILSKVLQHGFAGTSALAARFARPSVVFMGDSITQFWSGGDPWMFRPIRLNAGISGQTTAQMCERFDRDVVARRPRVVHIMGGTNDLWFGEPGAGGAASLANIAAMAGMARAAGIAVILAPPPPIGRVAEPMFAHLDCVDALRGGVADLARAEGLIFVDYAQSLVRDGDLFAPFTTDGVHLTPAGYRAIRGQAEAAISLALSRARERVG
ncbi:lysophospholipase L1-like esterase [Sphingomonas vulcanisoli]|uniref:Lysophospholipase L1-like esterase n=1 Tax=Sphingomonas vulcanisoli TaxID=1658060 RepID=A0ABX0TRQ2_9SPHN|nr:GDSL-type esterase/lipase family protein [Sphingomonas vulcanisoli]NIJ08136.1 lysophospholipase L1-like esterase [Sphingomonas vulcanisoli]